MPQSISLLTWSEFLSSISSFLYFIPSPVWHRVKHVSPVSFSVWEYPSQPHHSLGVPSHWSIPARVRLQDLAIIQLLSSVGSLQATPFLVGTNSLKHPQGSHFQTLPYWMCSLPSAAWEGHSLLIFIFSLFWRCSSRDSNLEPEVSESESATVLPRTSPRNWHAYWVYKGSVKYNFVPSILFYQILYIL